MSKKIDVYIRVRLDIQNNIWTSENDKIYRMLDNKQICYKGFNYIFHNHTNHDIYLHGLKNIVSKFLQLENCTIFAYGQTGSGKTYTILGKEDGIIIFSLQDILNIRSVYLSCMEVYNEKIYDMSTSKELRIFTVDNIPVVSNVVKKEVYTLEDAKKFIKLCESNRKYGSTEFNLRSSRSHTVFQVTYRDTEEYTLNIIDLAGSEKASILQSRRVEGSYINKSLLSLCTLLKNIQEGRYIGFRDSKLTRILQKSLDGETNVVSLCMISPSADCVDESIATLNFAARLTNVELKKTEKIVEPIKVEFDFSSIKIHKLDMKQGFYMKQKKLINKEKFIDDKMKSNDIDDKDSDDRARIRFINDKDSKNDMQKEKSEISVFKDFITREDRMLQELDKIDVSEYNEIKNGDLKYNERVIFQKNKSFCYAPLEYKATKPENKIDFYEIVEDGFIPSDKEIIDDIDGKEAFETIPAEKKTNKLIELLNERIGSLENMILDLLKSQPSKRIQDIFILEKHMFNLKKNSLEDNHCE